MKTKEKLPVDNKLILCIALVLLIVLLIPILQIAKYNVPCADDYSYGLLTHKAFEETHSLYEVVKAALSTVKNSYSTWQGTFSGIFVMTLQPAVFGEQYYFITTYLILFLLFFGIYSITKQILRVFTNDIMPLSALTITIFALIIFVEFIPYMSEGLYWFNGAVYYSGFFGIALTAYSFIIKVVKNTKSNVANLIILSVLLFALGGTNYPIALLTAEILCLTEAILLVKKNSKWKPLLFPIVVFFVAFVINVTAPGNEIRQSNFEKQSIFDTVVSSFFYGTKMIDDSVSLPIILLLMLLIPVFTNIAIKTNIKFVNPIIVALISFCLLSSMNAPIFYVTDSWYPGRYVNIVFYCTILLIIFNVLYSICWFVKKVGIEKKTTVRMPYIVLIFSLFIISIWVYKDYHNVTSINALDSLVNGEAKMYSDIFEDRLEKLEDDTIKDAVLPKYNFIPNAIYFDDITTNPNDWRNVAVADFYDKNTVIVG